MFPQHSTGACTYFDPYITKALSHLHLNQSVFIMCRIVYKFIFTRLVALLGTALEAKMQM